MNNRRGNDGENDNDINQRKEPNRRARRWLQVGARVALGSLFVLSGLNHLTGLVPMPPMVGRTSLFWEGLHQTGYFFPLLGLVEVVAGALLFARRCVPLALVMIAPVLVHVVMFHAWLAPQGLGVAGLATAALIFLARQHRAAFHEVLAAKAPWQGGGARALEVMLGLVFVASGIAGALGRTPPPATVGAATMMRGLEAAGYFMPLLAVVQVSAGALLLARRWVGLALTVLAPVMVEIVAYRLYVAAARPGMLLVSAILVVAMVALAFAHRKVFDGWAAVGASTSARWVTRRQTVETPTSGA